MRSTEGGYLIGFPCTSAYSLDTALYETLRFRDYGRRPSAKVERGIGCWFADGVEETRGDPERCP